LALNVPAGQLLHENVPVLKVPGGHCSKQDDDPSVEN
jgi:hypothetical protein